VIRSFRKQALYRRANEVKIDDSMSAYFALKAVDRWLSFRLEALGTAIVFFSALFAMMQTAEAGRAGIALSQALGITSLLNWAVRQGADVESLMNSVERVMYIIDKTPSEKYFMPDDPMHNAIGSGHIYDNSKLADDSVEDANGPAKSGPPSGDAALALAQSGWPWRGAISFSGVSMRYRHDMEPVLRGVTFDVLPGESIGIVGRTVSRGDHTHTHMPTHMPETIKPIYCSPLHPIVMYMH
jgi:ABC-type multidrug transport system fused ATPase/permease subunit